MSEENVVRIDDDEDPFGLEAAPEGVVVADSVEEELVIVDEESMALVNIITGEIMGYQEIPPENLPDMDIARWIGERRSYHKGRAAALRAEKQVWQDVIDKRFDSRIKRHDSALTWFENTYHNMLLGLAKQLIGDGKKRSAAVGLLLLKFQKTRAKTEVLDEEKAIAYLKLAGLTDAIKVKESILVSMIPDDLKAKLVKEKNQEKVGIAFRPGGDDELKLD